MGVCGGGGGGGGGVKVHVSAQNPKFGLWTLTTLHRAKSEYLGQRRSIVEQICIIIRED